MSFVVVETVEPFVVMHLCTFHVSDFGRCTRWPVSPSILVVVLPDSGVVGIEIASASTSVVGKSDAIGTSGSNMFAITLEACTVDAALAVLVVHGWTCSRSIRMPSVVMFADSSPVMIPSTGTSVSSTIIIILNASASIGDVRTPVARPYVSMKIRCSLISLKSLVSFSSSWTSFTETLF
jgi:hypothetical protein